MKRWLLYLFVLLVICANVSAFDINILTYREEYSPLETFQAEIILDKEPLNELTSLNFEFYGDCFFRDFLITVVHGHFKVGDRGFAARAVQQNSATLIHQAFVVNLLECPPDGFHIIAIHGLVGIIKIHPARNPPDSFSPFIHEL